MSLSVVDLRDVVQEACATTIPDTADVSKSHEELAYILKCIADMRSVLTDAYQYVEDLLVEAAPSKEFSVPGFSGPITVRTGNKRQAWDHDALWKDVTQALLETTDHPQEFVAGLRAAMTASWKVTGLRPLGIDPDEYCEVVWGRKTVQLPKEAPSVPGGSTNGQDPIAGQASVDAPGAV